MPLFHSIACSQVEQTQNTDAFNSTDSVIEMATAAAAVAVEFSADENQLIDDCFAFIKPVIRNAGELVKEGFSKSNNDLGIVYKQSWDKVTDYDLKTEAFLLNAIKAEYADHK